MGVEIKDELEFSVEAGYMGGHYTSLSTFINV